MGRAAKAWHLRHCPTIRKEGVNKNARPRRELRAPNDSQGTNQVRRFQRNPRLTARVVQFRAAVDARMSVSAPPCQAPPERGTLTRRPLAKCWATSLASLLARRPCRIKQKVLGARVRRIELIVRAIGA
jgi:hypothetical protein